MTGRREVDGPGNAELRLQRVLAAAGVGSRRHCEELIEAGRVSVDGETVLRQGLKVDPAAHVIRVDGQRVVTDTDLRYVALNKPAGVVSTMHDERGRPAVGDSVRRPGLFHVGRLDVATEGLLLLTNDGELAHRLMHPSFGVPKVYLAEIEGRLLGAERQLLRTGVTLEDGPAAADRVRITGQAANRTLVEITVHEGRNRLVRRMFEAVGHPVRQLVRTAYGPLQLGNLRSGRSRPLSRPEVAGLYELVER